MADNASPVRFDLRTRIVMAPESSFHSLIAEQKRVMSKVSRSLRARQVHRFRNHLLETNKTSPKLDRIEEADPEFEYLKALGWDDPPTTSDEPEWEERWEQKPEGPGPFGTWLGSSFKKWREGWVKGGKPAIPRDDVVLEQEPRADGREDGTGGNGGEEDQDRTETCVPQDPAAAADTTTDRDENPMGRTPSTGQSSDGRVADHSSSTEEACQQSAPEPDDGFQVLSEARTNTNEGRCANDIDRHSSDRGSYISSRPPSQSRPQHHTSMPSASADAAATHGSEKLRNPLATTSIPSSPQAQPAPKTSSGSAAMATFNVVRAFPSRMPWEIFRNPLQDPQSRLAQPQPQAQTGSGSDDTDGCHGKVSYHSKTTTAGRRDRYGVDGRDPNDAYSTGPSSRREYSDQELRDIYHFYRTVYRPKKREGKE